MPSPRHAAPDYDSDVIYPLEDDTWHPPTGPRTESQHVVGDSCHSASHPADTSCHHHLMSLLPPLALNSRKPTAHTLLPHVDHVASPGGSPRVGSLGDDPFGHSLGGGGSFGGVGGAAFGGEGLAFRSSSQEEEAAASKLLRNLRKKL